MRLRDRLPARLSPPHPWRPLSERELRFCWPVLEELCGHEIGRPAQADLLTRFEACLEAACSGLPWRDVSVAGMKGDTVHRTFRRWAQRGLWMALLERVSRAGMPALEYFLCRAFRRAWRMQGLRGILVARQCGLASAVRAPFHRLPDPLLSARWHRRVILPGLRRVAEVPGAVAVAFLRQARGLLTLCGGARRIRRCWEPA